MATPTTSNVTEPLAFGYDVSLDDRLFRSAVGPGRTLNIETAPIEAPRVDTASTADEIVDDFGRVFARSRWDGGEGQFRAHEEGAAPNRFWDSKGVSVAPAGPGEFHELELLPDTELISATSGGVTPTRQVYDGTDLFSTFGSSVRVVSNLTHASPTVADEDPHDGETSTPVQDLAVLGADVYAALGSNGIHRRVSGTWSHWNDLDCRRVWAVKGRIVAAKDESIFEVSSSGAAPSALKTLEDGTNWTSVTDAGAAVLASADNGYVYAFTDDSGTLSLAAQSLFEGEDVIGIGASRGVVLVATQPRSSSERSRLWAGVLAENNVLADLQLVRIWTSSTGLADPPFVTASGDSIYVGGIGALWRYDLSTAGLSRHLVAEGGSVEGIAAVDDRLWFSIASEGLFRESSSYVSSGYLVGPLGDFFSASDKSWVGAKLDTAPMSSGEQVDLYYTTDHEALNDPDSSSWIRAVRHTEDQVADEVALANVTGRSLAGMVKLSGDGSSTPAVRSFSFRAYPSAGDGEVIATVPINVSDQIERPGRHRVRARGVGDAAYADLKAKEGRSTILNLYRVGERVRGLVEKVGVPIQAVTPRGSVTLYAQVTVRGRRVGSGTTTEVGTFGTSRLFGTQPNFSEVS